MTVTDASSALEDFDCDLRVIPRICFIACLMPIATRPGQPVNWMKYECGEDSHTRY
jgi:hypothetical protein